ncbi:Lrp/AsnC family transcriptional regulator [Pseudodonghicola xiamenensis]|uniref:AsnC family transcriptional regulator n=1 Tax=Pseudodonghicola xiamenensis TaxID=337702 RepID=A0A8J3MCW2_9RHOB|nr:AsnC family transcriptional regulator [Pseudodonghicola xiamenensis]GHG91742.1 AsnC family transcriptional regulator [Pseudodonghicola xiamenensis]
MIDQIDQMDRRLLGLLRENARMSVTDLARQLGLARTTVQARIDRLERADVIAGYTLRASPVCRPPLRATVLISIEPRNGPAVLARLRSLPAVETVHTTSGRFDFMVQIAAETTVALDQTLDRIGEAKGVRSLESLIHLSTKIDRAL